MELDRQRIGCGVVGKQALGRGLVEGLVFFIFADDTAGGSAKRPRSFLFPKGRDVLVVLVDALEDASRVLATGKPTNVSGKNLDVDAGRLVWVVKRPVPGLERQVLPGYPPILCPADHVSGPPGSVGLFAVPEGQEELAAVRDKAAGKCVLPVTGRAALGHLLAPGQKIQFKRRLRLLEKRVEFAAGGLGLEVLVIQVDRKGQRNVETSVYLLHRNPSHKAVCPLRQRRQNYERRVRIPVPKGRQLCPHLRSQTLLVGKGPVACDAEHDRDARVAGRVDGGGRWGGHGAIHKCESRSTPRSHSCRRQIRSCTEQRRCYSREVASAPADAYCWAFDGFPHAS
ncbi:hypothetical protein GGP56_003404 [Salinibacter ruber]|nr:hypothetical protein [Salinibacter ruber]